MLENALRVDFLKTVPLWAGGSSVRAGTFTLEKGAGAVKHTRHMFVSKDNTLFHGVPSSTVLGNAMGVDFVTIFEEKCEF